LNLVDKDISIAQVSRAPDQARRLRRASSAAVRQSFIARSSPHPTGDFHADAIYIPATNDIERFPVVTEGMAGELLSLRT
jgi:hypothetical protein